MAATQLSMLGTVTLTCCLFCACGRTFAQPGESRIVRLAELEIDPAQLDKYKAALREEIETSIRVEPGVLTLYAVSVKGHPTQIRMFETYADQRAYEVHLQTPHFQQYKTGTKEMVKSLILVATDPVLLSTKAKRVPRWTDSGGRSRDRSGARACVGGNGAATTYAIRPPP